MTLIAEGRLSELRSLKSSAFDFKKLIRLCEELNVTYHEKCYFATAMLTRSLLDHVPPLFERKNFDEVASNYGGRSFKGTMQHLQSASRNVADGHLHQQIRNSEVLPTAQQVNCAQQLDALLEEIVRITKGQRRYSLRAGVILFFLFKKTPRTAGQVNGIVPSVRFIFHWHLVRAIAD